MHSILFRQLHHRRLGVVAAKAYSNSAPIFGRHHGSSLEKYQKARSNKKKKKYVDSSKDRKGKIHSPPGMRLAKKIEQSHQFEASLLGNRHPAMWNDPYYEKLYEDIVALVPGPEVEGSLKDLLSVDPDVLKIDLENRYLQKLNQSKIQSLDSLNVHKLMSSGEMGQQTMDFVNKFKNDLISQSNNNNKDQTLSTVFNNSLNTMDDPSEHTPNLFTSSQFSSMEEQSLPIEAPSSEEWRHLIRVLGAHGRIQDAMNVVKERCELDPSFEKDESMFAALIVASGDSKNIEQAEAIFDDMRWNGLTPSVISWSALLHAQIRCGKLDAAFLIIQRMQEQGVTPNVSTFTSLLTGIFLNTPRDECFDQANETWFQMGVNGVEPNLLTYTAMIKCCCRGREIERALNYIDEMRQQNIRPSVVTYNTLLRGVAYAPQWHRSVAMMTDEILDMMQGDEIVPNSGTFHALITACAAVGDVVNAKAYFEEMETKFHLTPTPEIYVAMLDTLGASQAICKPESSKRFLTRGRSWPIIPILQEPGIPISEKTSRLNWDLMDEEKGKKFRGFLDDNSDDLDYSGSDDEEYENIFSLNDENDNNNESSSQGFGSLVENDDYEEYDEDENQLTSSSSSSSSSLTEAEGAKGIPWRERMEQQRKEAQDIIAKGEKKRLAKLNRLDIDYVEPEIVSKKKKSKETGYKGAKTLDEEWELLVKDVYESVQNDPMFPEESIMKLKKEVDKYPEKQEMDFSLIEANFPSQEEEEEVSSVHDELMKEFQDDDVVEHSPLQAMNDLNAMSGTSSNLAQFQAPEDGMPWITTEELLSFDWEEARRNAPLCGPRYIELHRLIDHMEESKEFSKLSSLISRQETNIETCKTLMLEMEQKGMDISVGAMNGALSVYTKGMKRSLAEQFMNEFEARNIEPNHKTYCLLVEMFIRANQLEKALEAKSKMVNTIGADEEVYGLLVRHLADKNLIQDSLALLDDAMSHNITIRERHKRELRRLLEKDGIALHPLIGADPQKWRKDAAIARRSTKKRDTKKPYKLRNMMVGH